MPGEEPARAFLDDWQAAHLLHTPWDERVAYIFLLYPGRGPGAQEVHAAPDAGLRGGGGVTGILYDSAVVKVEGDGIWVASYDGTAGDNGPRSLARLDELGAALDTFAAWPNGPPAASSVTGPAATPTSSPESCATVRQTRG